MKYLPEKSTLEILRDCLKLASYMGDNKTKIYRIRKQILAEFRKNRFVVEEDQIDKLRFNAIKGVSNFTIYTVKEQMSKEDYKPKSIYKK